LTAELIGWLDEHSLDHRRRMRNAMLVSLAIHGLVIALFAASPPAQFAPLPEVLAVELVAAPPSSRPPPRAKPSPPPKAASSERATPPPPTPAPPVTKAPVQVLPEEAPGRIRKVKPEVAPKSLAKVKPEPKPEPELWRPEREEPPDLEDVMAGLYDETGLNETAGLVQSPASVVEDSKAEASSEVRQSQPGAAISPELAAWNLEVQRLIQSKWVMPSNFRNRDLATGLELRLAASGELIGSPKVVQSSGDPFFDDNAVAALLKAAPLPPVTKPGRRIFIFRSEAN